MSTLSEYPPEDATPSTRLPDRLAVLEKALGGDLAAIDWSRISRSAEDLHLLFTLLAGTWVRAGTAFDLNVLLEGARRAAWAGAVTWQTPLTLRINLERLASRLRHARLWCEEQPLWWAPIPEPCSEESFWLRLTSGGEALRWPERSILRQAFHQASGESVSRGWLAIESLVPPQIIADLQVQLESAYQSGVLTMEREGVGAAGKISVRRSDLVLYTDGRDQALLKVVPQLSVLVQLVLRAIEERLVDALPGRVLAAPQNAMLARYPAPSSGYAPHMDNPGGERDNGRALTMVVYLNGPDEPCAGGELDLWQPGRKTTQPPSATVRPNAGAAALFEARTVAHRVRELHPGPARWALTFWLNDLSTIQPMTPSAPEVSTTEALLRVERPLLPEGQVLFHEFDADGFEAEDENDPAGKLRSRPVVDHTAPRVGVVCTVYRGGSQIQRWLDQHFALGAEHAVLIFDHLEEPAEQQAARRVREQYPEERLTIWSGDALRRNAWQELSTTGRNSKLLRHAGEGSRSHAVASRQTLNASLALEKARTDELGGRPLDWLLHLDIDEFFHLQGRARGGRNLLEHFQILDGQGVGRVRYLNHELLPGEQNARFKINPRLARAYLGVLGWNRLVAHLKMGQDDSRPYFNGYLNGKSAIRVSAGLAAAGVHGWHARPGTRTLTLAGPCILHHHFSEPSSFRDKYLAIASSSKAAERPFPPSPTEVAALKLIADLEHQKADQQLIGQELEKLHRARNHFTANEVAWLEDAGLLLDP